MRIHIEPYSCIGCSICRNTAPSLFYINGYHAETFSDVAQRLRQDELLIFRLYEVMETCPAGAITLEYEDGENPPADNGCSARVLPFDS